MKNDEHLNEHAVDALTYMGVGERVSHNMWENMVYAAKDMSFNHEDYLKTMRDAEVNYIEANIPEQEREYLKNGRIKTGTHLSSTYKQYKSRISSAIKYHVDLVDDNDVPRGATQVQKDISAIKSLTNPKSTSKKSRPYMYIEDDLYVVQDKSRYTYGDTDSAIAALISLSS